jgi:cytosine/adenosine deaminase-related metal-dependent hydrolase
VGSIADGQAADFVVVRDDTVGTAGARAGQILYCATRADVDRVVVGGRTIVADGKHILGDVPALLISSLAALREHR